LGVVSGDGMSLVDISGTGGLKIGKNTGRRGVLRKKIKKGD